MKFYTKMYDEDGNPVEVDFKLDIYSLNGEGVMSVEQEEDNNQLAQFNNGDCIYVDILGEKGWLGQQKFVTIVLEVYKTSSESASILTIKEIRR